MKAAFLSLTSLALLALPSLAAGKEWQTDFEAARKQAAAEGKDLLVDFTGTDWCKWCIQLTKEVFIHDSFNAGVKDHFILVELDYPRDKSKLSEELIKQNEALKTKYGITGFPTVLLIDSDGLPYARTGYKKGGPELYVTHLDELRAKKTERDEAFTTAEKLEGVDKAKALMKGLEVIPESLRGQYPSVGAEIQKLDPNDQTGYAADKVLKAKLESLNEEFRQLRKDDDLKIALERVNAFIATQELKDYQLQSVLGMKVNIGLQSKDYALALEAINGIIDANPDNGPGENAKVFKPNLIKMLEEAKAEEAAAKEDEDK